MLRFPYHFISLDLVSFSYHPFFFDDRLIVLSHPMGLLTPHDFTLAFPSFPFPRYLYVISITLFLYSFIFSYIFFVIISLSHTTECRLQTPLPSTFQFHLLPPLPLCYNTSLSSAQDRHLVEPVLFFWYGFVFTFLKLACHVGGYKIQENTVWEITVSTMFTLD
jgi:hypothetical protein